MGHKGFLGVAACGLAATVLMPTAAQAQQDRVSATEKGSLLIYSKVEVRYNSSGDLIQDTFVTLTNDATTPVEVQMYFVDGDGNGYDSNDTSCYHQGWNVSDVLIQLTANQPTYWSVDDPGGFTPFSVLEPACPGNDGPGRYDSESQEYYIRGMIYAWAVDKDAEPCDGDPGIYEVKHNHLSGGATLINYSDKTAWEYNAWAFQRLTDGCGDAQLDIDGVEYAQAFGLLLMNFQAVGSSAFSNGVGEDVTDMVTTNTDVTLHPVGVNFDVDSEDNEGPIVTKAHYDVWNENEFKLSGAFRCIICWDQTLLSDYGIPNHFLINTLQTDHGKARIDGLASPLCNNLNVWYGGGIPGSALVGDSQDAAILGVVARDYHFDSNEDPEARSGTNLIGMGLESATIIYGEMAAPPELPTTPSQLIDRMIRR